MIGTNKKIFLIVASRLTAGPQQLLERMPELGIIAEVEIIRLAPAAAADSRAQNWLGLGREIFRRYNQAAGFVILHGLDNLLYASSAQSFLFANLGKPVIFTGQLDWENQAETYEFRANLINACQAATFNFGEVALLLGNRLLRANQSRLTAAGGAAAFTAPESGVLGRIDFSIRLFEKNIRKNKGVVKFSDVLNDNIAIVEVSPWLDAGGLKVAAAGAAALLLKAESYYGLPTPLEAELDRIAATLPVIVWSANRKFTLGSKKICLINNLTWEAAVTKLMAVMAAEKKLRPIKESMAKDLAGEIIE